MTTIYSMVVTRSEFSDDHLKFRLFETKEARQQAVNALVSYGFTVSTFDHAEGSIVFFLSYLEGRQRTARMGISLADLKTVAEGIQNSALDMYVRFASVAVRNKTLPCHENPTEPFGERQIIVFAEKVDLGLDRIRLDRHLKLYE